jgi:hypothetical protein
MVQAVIQTTVTGLQGNPITAGTPATNQALTWNGTAWAAGGPFAPTASPTFTGTATFATLNGTTATIGGVGITANSINASGSGNFGPSTIGGVTLSGGTVTAPASIAADNLIVSSGARIVSQGSANQPSVAVSDQSTNVAMGMFVVTQAPTLGFGQTNAQGVPTTSVMQLGTNGNLSITGVFSQGSDQTNKNTITAYAPGVSIASQLLPKTFIYNDDTTNTQHLGFIAQDVQPVLPDAVSSTPGFGSGAAATLSLDITAIVAVLANAVKQLISRVAALENHDGITPTAAETA